MQGPARTLPFIEDEACEFLRQECVVNLSQVFIDNFLRIYNSSKEKGQEHLDFVDKLEFLYNIPEDPFFEPYFDEEHELYITPMRESVDGERESLSDVIFRIHTDKALKGPKITWDKFLEYFCSRGHLREHETLIFSGQMISDLDSTQMFTGRWENVNLEEQRIALERMLKNRLVTKQNLVLKGGKGKYDVTVPEVFNFIKYPHRKGMRPTIKEQKKAAEEQRRQKQEERANRKTFKANEIPKTTS